MEDLLKLNFWGSCLFGTGVFGYLCDNPDEAINYLFYALGYCLFAGILLWFYCECKLQKELEEQECEKLF